MCNLGKIDRILRAVAGTVIIVWGLMTQNYWGAVGLVLLATAAISFCPLYPLLKLNTGCKKS
ncbi:MAG: DUF2892 domain-containing protein [Sulfurimonas sp.]|nr:DUF2892 domain-containing protein [Sulfurimonas sp.]MDD3059337.1 DUF2892 domain-containing protein [Sulfurimonas sp.]MDD5202132.1 DUF2892 domain-containing protein [Sulfurimonas sp.]